MRQTDYLGRQSPSINEYDIILDRERSAIKFKMYVAFAVGMIVAFCLSGFAFYVFLMLVQLGECGLYAQRC